MPERHEFRRVRAPGLKDFAWPIVAALLALGLTGACFAELAWPALGGNDLANRLAVPLLTLIAWGLALYVTLPVLHLQRAFAAGEPVLALDPAGMSFGDWRGRPLLLPWPVMAVTGLRDKGEWAAMRVRSGGRWRLVWLRDLDTSPDEILDLVEQFTGNQVRPAPRS